MSNANRMWVSTNKGLFEYEKAGAGYRPKMLHFKAAPCQVSLIQGDRIWAALKHGHFGVKLHRSDDGGKTWKELGAPKYPPYPEGKEPEKNPFSGKVIPWNTEMIWCLEAGGRPGEIWCGTLPGGVFRSTDYGETWQLCESLWKDSRRLGWFGGGYDYAGVHSIAVDPANPDHVVIAISCGGVWETKDAGQNWELLGRGMIASYMPPGQQEEPNTQDPHRLAACASDFKTMYVQHHCAIFKSVNGGRNFEKIGPDMGADPSGFGFAVAVHPKDPNTAWFVPAHSDELRIPVAGRVEVLRTKDGGKTFQQLQTGLPQENAYDLTYRHALDVAADGSHLAFGSTSGNLWASADGGDTWQTVSNHLPAIYAVRFG